MTDLVNVKVDITCYPAIPAANYETPFRQSKFTANGFINCMLILYVDERRTYMLFVTLMLEYRSNHIMITVWNYRYIVESSRCHANLHFYLMPPHEKFRGISVKRMCD